MNVRFDLPVVDASTREYWRAAKHDAQLLMTQCDMCQEVTFYPRPFCIKCNSDEVHWLKACGRATLYTYSIVRHNDLPPFNTRTPYVAALVDLAEGPRMTTNLVGVELEDIEIGMPLRVQFMELTDDYALPVFGPAVGNGGEE